jgi:hypothetical protein
MVGIRINTRHGCYHALLLSCSAIIIALKKLNKQMEYFIEILQITIWPITIYACVRIFIIELMKPLERWVHFQIQLKQ